ncbi:glycosyltransferase family 2 protein [Sphaerotilus sp.]|uniref:glycosyltransferase family 2 protein n=1 Tax=Sphaerotilus sp. TaxID=2093942 RepID=UPI002ACECE80|nr:glycosyltransferase [Sphaerotilus sp.]MDZ7855410.1 glycosyltransferase [Sphaerotilus sp.]
MPIAVPQAALAVQAPVSVSVLMPVYNAADHLEDAVRSILTQTLTDLELVIVDDGSTDESPAILARLQAEDARIRVLRQPNGGIVSALNLGLSHCTGVCIARMDADDIALPERLARQWAAFEADPSLVLCGTALKQFGDRHGMLRFPSSDAGCRALLMTWSCFAHPTVMMRRETLLLSGLRYEADYQHAEDYQLWSALAERGRLCNLPEPLLHYRVHERQISQARKASQEAVHLRVSSANLARVAVKLSTQELAPVLFARGNGPWRSLVSTLVAVGRCRRAPKGVLLPLVRRGLRVTARNALVRLTG